jgi:hypothetical protein
MDFWPHLLFCCCMWYFFACLVLILCTSLFFIYCISLWIHFLGVTVLWITVLWIKVLWMNNNDLYWILFFNDNQFSFLKMSLLWVYQSHFRMILIDCFVIVFVMSCIFASKKILEHYSWWGAMIVSHKIYCYFCLLRQIFANSSQICHFLCNLLCYIIYRFIWEGSQLLFPRILLFHAILIHIWPSINLISTLGYRFKTQFFFICDVVIRIATDLLELSFSLRFWNHSVRAFKSSISSSTINPSRNSQTPQRTH